MEPDYKQYDYTGKAIMPFSLLFTTGDTRMKLYYICFRYQQPDGSWKPGLRWVVAGSAEAAADPIIDEFGRQTKYSWEKICEICRVDAVNRFMPA